jgi:hypothetical protein
VKVLFKRNEYDNYCEKCIYFIRKFDEPQKYPKTILIICRLNRQTIDKCPLTDMEISYGLQ